MDMITIKVKVKQHVTENDVSKLYEFEVPVKVPKTATDFLNHFKEDYTYSLLIDRHKVRIRPHLIKLYKKHNYNIEKITEEMLTWNPETKIKVDPTLEIARKTIKTSIEDLELDHATIRVICESMGLTAGKVDELIDEYVESKESE